MKAPAFQFYAAEYLADERVQLMTIEEEGVYIRLLSYCWREGSIPADPVLLSRLCKGAHVDAMSIVTDAFDPKPGDPTRLIHTRLEKERAKQETFRQKQKGFGIKGAKKRWEESEENGVAHTDPIGLAKGSPSHDPHVMSWGLDGSSSSSSSSTAVVPPKPPQEPPASPSGEGDGGRKPKDNRPTSPEAIAIAELFHRRLNTHWSDKEIAAYRDGLKRGVITMDAIAEIRTYYAAERAKGDGEKGGRHRRDLQTFLNNFGGEVDRARAANPKPKMSADYLQTEWPEWLKSQGQLFVEYQFAPSFLKDDFQKARKAAKAA